MTLTLPQMLAHVSIKGGVTPEEKDRLGRYCVLKHNRDTWTEAIQHRPLVSTSVRNS